MANVPRCIETLISGECQDSRQCRWKTDMRKDHTYHTLESLIAINDYTRIVFLCEFILQRFGTL